MQPLSKIRPPKKFPAFSGGQFQRLLNVFPVPASTPQTPIVGSEGSSGYGATGGGATSTGIPGPAAREGAGSMEFRKSSNGIPHR